MQTKNNQTFFVVIDRASNANNVYMLALIDENDLQEFLTEDDEEEASGLALPEGEEKSFEEIQAEEEADKALEAEKQKAEAKKGTIMFVIVLFVAAGLFCGGYYYFKFYKPRKEEENAESEDLEDGRWNDADDYEPEIEDDYEEPVEPDDVYEDDVDAIDTSDDADNNEEIDQ